MELRNLLEDMDVYTPRLEGLLENMAEMFEIYVDPQRLVGDIRRPQMQAAQSRKLRATLFFDTVGLSFL